MPRLVRGQELSIRELIERLKNPDERDGITKITNELLSIILEDLVGEIDYLRTQNNMKDRMIERYKESK